MAHSTLGRHRAPGRYNPVSELSGIATRAGVTGAKASAVLAASGGLVAAFALPASAAPDSAKASAVAAPVAPAAAKAAPAISAPAVTTPAKAPSVGVVGVTVVAKPKPKPKPAPQVATQRTTTETVSRSATRARTTATKSAIIKRKAQPAPTNNNVAQSASGVVNIARGLLGIYYVYGGSTTAGFDCSGFTQYVYKKAGISIPRTASAQQRAATRVTNPRPGDLVFYGSPAYHVGIFTGGDMMIDSPRTGKKTSERNMWGTPTGFGRF